MSFSGKTLLLPNYYPDPHPFVFFKVITEGENPFDDMPIKRICLTPKGTDTPVIAQVASVDIFDDELMMLVKEDNKDMYSVNTRNYYIMEEDKVECELQIKFENITLETINDEMENKLMKAMIRDPSIAQKIPKVLWQRPSFKRKIDVERTKGRLRSLDTIGDSTGAIHFNSVLSDDNVYRINEMLGVQTDPVELAEARRRKTMRLTPVLAPPRAQENARDGYFSSFRRMFGRGTRRKGRKRTRRFKK
uniref:Uncharacterized protein n=1 Tax=viral metagenome TaxID=1070528 RepID=A0A6C0HXE1_9ZZZZ